jgi:diaminohydroxyphosphoribosylaminopyrimidine deaminase/5-amino-6-(5-phosphoribosylamino)uracil reductase
MAGVSPEKYGELRALGCDVMELAEEGARPAVRAVLEELGRRRATNILVEGGPAVLGSFLDAREADEVHVFLAPRLAGGTQAFSALGGQGLERIADAVRVAEGQWESLEGDLYYRGRVNW